MTTPELDPGLQNELLKLAEERSTAVLAPIDVDANRFAEVIIAQANDGAVSAEYARAGVDFLGRLVGWKSKDINDSTGHIPIASLDLNREEDAYLDIIGVAFLSQNEHTAQTETLTEENLTTHYAFHQCRLNHKVRAVTIHRTQALDTNDAAYVDYTVTFEDVGEYINDEDKVLLRGRFGMEMLMTGTFAGLDPEIARLRALHTVLPVVRNI